MNRIPDGAMGKNPGTIKVIGIGQSLRGDDAAGLKAVHIWHEQYQQKNEHPGIQVDLVELPGIGLLSMLEGVKTVILVDAVHSNGKAGTIHIIPDDQLEAFSPGSGSAHGWGVAETLAIGKALLPSELPEEIILIGIEAGDLSLGESLSADVESALPGVVQLIDQILSKR